MEHNFEIYMTLLVILAFVLGMLIGKADSHYQLKRYFATGEVLKVSGYPVKLLKVRSHHPFNSDTAVLTRIESEFLTTAGMSLELRMLICLLFDSYERLDVMRQSGKSGWDVMPFEALAVPGMRNLQAGSYLDAHIYSGMLHYRKVTLEEPHPNTLFTDPGPDVV